MPRTLEGEAEAQRRLAVGVNFRQSPTAFTFLYRPDMLRQGPTATLASCAAIPQRHHCQEQQMNRKQSEPSSSVANVPKPRWRMFKYLMTGGVLGALFAGGLGLAANAGAMPWSGPGCRMGMFGGLGHHGPMNPEEMRARLEFGTDWILDKVEATPAQRRKLADGEQVRPASVTPAIRARARRSVHHHG